MTVDGRRHEFSGYNVAAANNKAYGGGMFLAPHAELNDGQLDVVLIEQIGKLRYLANLPTVFKGTHVEKEGVTVLRGPRSRSRPTDRSPCTPTAITSPTSRPGSTCCRALSA